MSLTESISPPDRTELELILERFGDRVERIELEVRAGDKVSRKVLILDPAAPRTDKVKQP